MLKLIFIVFYIKNSYIFAKEITTKNKQNETEFKRHWIWINSNGINFNFIINYLFIFIIMKTAMQELFSQLEIEHPNLFNTNTLEGRKFINDYYKFFELEKEQIIDAISNANKSNNRNVSLNPEQYYKETFKKK